MYFKKVGKMSSTPCQQVLSPSPALRVFLEDLKHQTQINCIQIQCDNARKPVFCLYKNCWCGSSFSRKNYSMPDMKSRDNNSKRDTKLDQQSRNASAKLKQKRLRRPTSMPNFRTTKRKDHMISRWTEGKCDTRPRILNAYWSDDLSSYSPKSPTCFVGETIQEFPPDDVCNIPLHQQHRASLPNYAIALDFVRQKYGTTDGTSTPMMVRGENGMHSSQRLQKRGRQPFKCEEILIPPVRRQSLEDDDLADETAARIITVTLPLTTVGDIPP